MELERILEDLERVCRESAVKDWDGYDAEPVKEESYSGALRFARLIPAEVPSPEVFATPNGDICFEWYKERNNEFCVGVGNGTLFYAGSFGTEKFQGKAYFQEEIPNEILPFLERVK